VALLSRDLADAAGFPAPFVKNIHISGLVHDIGKIGVPEAVLRKQGRLDEAEDEAIKQHPEVGFRILRDIPQFAPILDGVRYHHERYDGHGYPHGLAGESIPLSARIIALADTFDAMSSNRTYRSARSRADVIAEMARLGGTQFDPQLLEHFLRLDFSAYDRMMSGSGVGSNDGWRKAA
jgi:putative two-component system response regulator